MARSRELFATVRLEELEPRMGSGRRHSSCNAPGPRQSGSLLQLRREELLKEGRERATHDHAIVEVPTALGTVARLDIFTPAAFGAGFERDNRVMPHRAPRAPEPS